LAAGLISARRDAFVCATDINAEGAGRSDWLPADAVADDKRQSVSMRE
jgi:hypothetical protein